MGFNSSINYDSNSNNTIVIVTKSCPILCDPKDWSLPGSSVHGFLQARTMEQTATPFSRASSQYRDWTQVSRIVGGFFTSWATREARAELNWYAYLGRGLSRKFCIESGWSFRNPSLGGLKSGGSVSLCCPPPGWGP